ncbi:hypothetical protein LTR41_012069 [Exophiala xenobiotica]|nr:hypothetical protein LTR41_012069 [Exophiala xenobiotica]KAK5548617.1 hypothetical protein LTR46_011958 [Exophiala xenobiotica]
MAGHSCMNRYMFYEGHDWNRNLSPRQCGNRSFEKLRQRVQKGGKYNIHLQLIKIDDRGYGVRSNRTFEPNQIIVEYTGEIITQEECAKRIKPVYKNTECYYLMLFDQNMIIDATRGSIARFVNHSCAPNCTMEKWTVNGKPRMALFAGSWTANEAGPKQKSSEGDNMKTGKLAGVKRKIAEAIEETTSRVTKKANNPKRRSTGPPVSVVLAMSERRVWLSLLGHPNTYEAIITYDEDCMTVRKMNLDASDVMKSFPKHTLRLTKHVPGNTDLEVNIVLSKKPEKTIQMRAYELENLVKEGKRAWTSAVIRFGRLRTSTTATYEKQSREEAMN